MIYNTGLICKYCGKEVKEELVQDTLCTLTTSCDCKYMNNPIVCMYTFQCTSLDVKMSEDNVKNRFDKLQNSISRCRRLEEEHKSAYRYDEGIQKDFENNRFDTTHYGERACGSYNSDMEVSFKEGSPILCVDVNSCEYCFELDADVVRDLKAILDRFLESLESKEVNE